jgi:HlyD family secretion protein
VYTVQGRNSEGKGKDEGEEKGPGRLAAPPPATPSDSVKEVVSKPAVVWVKQDTTIVMRRVTTGMTNETERQVLSGLTTNDIVVTGYQQLTKEQKKKAATSPFMPARRGGNRSGGGGGNSGGGGNRPR